MLSCTEILSSGEHKAVLAAKDPALLQRLESPQLYLRPRTLVERSVEKFSIISSLNEDVKAANSLLKGGRPASYLSSYMAAIYAYYTQYMNGDISYDGAYLKMMAITGFVQPFTADIQAAKVQFLKDILRGVRLDHRDLRDSLNVEDPILDGLLDDIMAGRRSNIQAIQDRMIELKHGYESTLVKSFLTDDKIRKLITPRIMAEESAKVSDLAEFKKNIAMHLLRESLTAGHVDELLKIIFPSLDEATIMKIIQGHNQSMLTVTQFLIDPLLLAEAGFGLTQSYTANICIDPTDGSIRYHVSKDSIVLRKQEEPGMGDEYPLDGSIAIEYILEDEGFTLREIEISDPKLKQLVFAKTAVDMSPVIAI